MGIIEESEALLMKWKLLEVGRCAKTNFSIRGVLSRYKGSLSTQNGSLLQY
jgi:hypothetical protein